MRVRARAVCQSISSGQNSKLFDISTHRVPSPPLLLFGLSDRLRRHAGGVVRRARRVDSSRDREQLDLDIELDAFFERPRTFLPNSSSG